MAPCELHGEFMRTVKARKLPKWLKLHRDHWICANNVCCSPALSTDEEAAYIAQELVALGFRPDHMLSPEDAPLLALTRGGEGTS